jgi:hypothetical protein
VFRHLASNSGVDGPFTGVNLLRECLPGPRLGIWLSRVGPRNFNLSRSQVATADKDDLGWLRQTRCQSHPPLSVDAASYGLNRIANHIYQYLFDLDVISGDTRQGTPVDPDSHPLYSSLVGKHADCLGVASVRSMECHLG